MEDLSGEVLLTIFSYIENPLLLIDTIPLVCKNWNKLSKHFGAWRNARLNSQDFNRFQVLRVLRQAPALRNLYLDLNSSWTDVLPYLQEILRESTLTVLSALNVNGSRHCLEQSAEVILDLLIRSTGISQLQFRLENVHFQLVNSAQETFFSILNKMKKLNHLCLNLDPLVKCDKPSELDDLIYAFPRLDTLIIHGETISAGPLFLNTAYAVLKGCCSTLEHLTLLVPELDDFIMKFQIELQNCSSLRTIFVNFSLPRSAVRHWPHLREVAMQTQEMGFRILIPGTERFQEIFET